MLPASRRGAGVADLRFFTSGTAFGRPHPAGPRAGADHIPRRPDFAGGPDGAPVLLARFRAVDVPLGAAALELRVPRALGARRAPVRGHHISRAGASGPWALPGVRLRDTFLLASRTVIASLARNWKLPAARHVDRVRGDPEDPEHKSGWPMLGPLLPRLITLLTERDPALKNSTVHGVLEWPRPTQDDERRRGGRR